MDYDLLLFGKDVLEKRRLELIEQIADNADEISRIDRELLESHALDGIDPDEALI
jgi:hypothetical protein